LSGTVSTVFAEATDRPAKPSSSGDEEARLRLAENRGGRFAEQAIDWLAENAEIRAADFPHCRLLDGLDQLRVGGAVDQDALA
jgi:hypothetical protein